MKQKILVLPLIMAAAVVLLWAFPRFWYRDGTAEALSWFSERDQIQGWNFRAIPVSESAEKLLVADRTVNGEFTSSRGELLRVFSAKRYEEKANEIGLFIHTPDRCWVDAGWRIESSSNPTVRELVVHGMSVPVERRIFDYRGHRELVYFFGLMGGRSLPYRLDHYLSTGLRSSVAESGGRNLLRASDTHFWTRLWDSFQSRRDMAGPKQFIRISTPLGAENIAGADERLEAFLQQWLVPSDFAQERNTWKLAAASNKSDV